MFSKKKDLLTLIVRLIIGGIFVCAGWMKAVDMAATVGFFSQLGFAAFLAYIVTYVELIGGILIVLGIRTDVAASVLAVVMLVAIYVSFGLGFQGMMAPLAVLSGLIAILAHGAGSHVVHLKK
jgi:putative oxidoreductase